MNANERQIGGNHYRSDMQHWDLAILTNMSYLTGNATKYVSRWRKRGGVQDLEKALHYIDKLLESLGHMMPRSKNEKSDYEAKAERFCRVNRLDDAESEIIVILTAWVDRYELENAKRLLQELIEAVRVSELEPKYVPLEDSNKHAERGIR